VQQVGTPTEIYDYPANVFVAGFIGNPAMNLVPGSLKGGSFAGQNIEISGLGGPDGDVVLGFRAEDAALVDGGKKQGAGGLIDAPVYALELLGDATMVTVRAGGTMVCVKAHKDYRAAIGDQVQIQLPVTACHLFNSKSETRISGGK